MEVPSVSPSKTPDQISGHIVLLALGDDFRLARSAAAQVGQQVFDTQRQPRRAAVDDDEVTGAVADAGSGDAKQFAKGVAWHSSVVRCLLVLGAYL